jgi:hypothetical protein
VTALNKPTFYGNLVRLAGSVLRTGVNTAVTSTWGDWGQFIVDVAGELRLLATTVADQTVQGPVVPFAIATMYIAYLGTRENKTITQVIKERGLAVLDAAKNIVTTQTNNFKAAYLAEGARANAATLAAIAKQVKSNAPSGAGAAVITAEVRSVGAPAVGSPGGVTPGFYRPAPIQAIDKLAAADVDTILRKQEERKVAAALLALGDAVEPPAPAASAASASAAAAAASAAPASDVPLGSARRRRATKKRGPRRRVTRRMPRFAY